MTDTKSTASDELTLPDNLISHRSSWLRAMDRLVELEPESHEPDMDEKGYWRHERQAMLDMFADLDRLQSLRASIPGGVGVKGMEWLGEEGSPGKDIRAYPTPEIQYTVRHLDMDTFDVILNTDLGSKWFRNDGQIHASYAQAKAAAQANFERRILSALTDAPVVSEESKIALTVMTWMIEHGWLDDEHQYCASDILAALNDNAGPGAGYAVSDEMVERACRAQWQAERHGDNQHDAMKAALTAALSVKPQSGSDKP